MNYTNAATNPTTEIATTWSAANFFYRAAGSFEIKVLSTDTLDAYDWTIAAANPTQSSRVISFTINGTVEGDPLPN